MFVYVIPCNSGPIVVIKAESSFPIHLWTSSREGGTCNNKFKAMFKVGSTKPLNIGPPASAIKESA